MYSTVEPPLMDNLYIKDNCKIPTTLLYVQINLCRKDTFVMDIVLVPKC